MQTFVSILKIRHITCYHIEIQRMKENVSMVYACSVNVKFRALYLRNLDKNTPANFEEEISGKEEKFDKKTQQIGSNHRRLQLKIQMTDRRRSDISTDHAVCASARFNGSSECQKAPMTFASNKEATLKEA